MRILALLLVTLFLWGCGGQNAEDHWKEGEEHLKNGFITEAAASFEEIINNHPKSERAPEATFQMASLYQNQMFMNMVPEESYTKSVNYYRDVYVKYPDHEKAPLAMFMSGFIEANELKRYEEATETYNLFINKYPDHPMAESAREELEYMGLTPAEILKNKSLQE